MGWRGELRWNCLRRLWCSGPLCGSFRNARAAHTGVAQRHASQRARFCPTCLPSRVVVEPCGCGRDRSRSGNSKISNFVQWHSFVHRRWKTIHRTRMSPHSHNLARVNRRRQQSSSSFTTNVSESEWRVRVPLPIRRPWAPDRRHVCASSSFVRSRPALVHSCFVDCAADVARCPRLAPALLVPTRPGSS
jgi:hypothetical protein